MKSTKLITLVLLGALATGACKKKGCTDTTATNYSEEAKKDDGTCAYLPEITLTGAASVTVNLGETYTDLGATATNYDGSSVTVTTDDSDVNTSVAGTYIVTYTATNDNGSVSATRSVEVVFSQDYWTSNTWDITHDCGTTTFPLASPPTITSGATSSDLVLDSFFTLLGGTANATISGSTVTFPNQTITVTGGTIEFSGTGTMNAAGTEFSVDYTYDNTIPFVGGSGTCTAVYAKQ